MPVELERVIAHEAAPWLRVNISSDLGLLLQVSCQLQQVRDSRLALGNSCCVGVCTICNMVTACGGCTAALLLALAIAADAAALVEHSLDAGRSFTTAGRIHLQEDDAVSGLFERQPISSMQLSQLQELVESDRLYLWRVTLPDQPPVLTSIKAACLAPALASPQYALHLDSAGHIMSAQISVPAAALPGGSCSTRHALQALKHLSASQLSDPKDLEVAVHTPTPGPAVPKPAEAATPDLMAATNAAQQQAQQKQAQQRQQQQQQQQQRRPAGKGGAGKEGDGAEGEGEAAPPVDDRTWLQKNWLIVMAGATMVLNIVLKNVVDPQGQAAAAQQGRPQRRAIQ